MNKYSNKDLPNEIKGMISDLIKLYEIEYNELKVKVDYIIKNNIKDTIYIEQIIDQLLNIPYKPCYKLFIKLCNYLSQFNKQVSDDYLNFYKNLYDENTQKTKKKKL